MDQDLYDEFGNYIGPDLDSDSDSDPGADAQASTAKRDSEDVDGGSARDGANPDAEVEGTASNAIVLAEDKQLYPSASEAFGADIEALYQEEDTQRISQPLVAPEVVKVTAVSESAESAPSAKYDVEYLASAVLPTPELCRNVVLLGNLHHGKTTLIDFLFRNSHNMPWSYNDDRVLRYMDCRSDEQSLGISIKAKAACMLLPDTQGKSFGLNIIDTPGHPNFLDEALAAMQLADGAIVVVDVAEGLGLTTKTLLRKAALLCLDIVLVLTKLDRLFLELRLPPRDAYHKIRHVLETVNEVIVPLGVTALSPARGNVAFSAAVQQMCFTLPQFAAQYVKQHGGPFSAGDLAKRLWGDSYYDRKTRRFRKSRPEPDSQRTFVDFVLEPIYKLNSAVVADSTNDLYEKLARNSIQVPSGALKADVRGLLRTVMGAAFSMGSSSGLVSMVARYVRSPKAAALRKMRALGVAPERGNVGDGEEWMHDVAECRGDGDGAFVGYIAKLTPTDESSQQACDALVRILSGALAVGDHVRVLGDTYDADVNEEEQARAVVEGMYLPCGRFKISVSSARAGQVVVLRGVDETVFKSATIVSDSHSRCKRMRVFRPVLDHFPPSVVKVAVEPARPSELPKMVAGLRMCLKSYPGLVSKVEESGEHALIGSGELYMDCVLRDLREAFAEIQIKVSDPVVPFAETVSEASVLQCHAETPNKQNKIVMMAEPLEASIVDALTAGKFRAIADDDGDAKQSRMLRDHGWDALAARSLWAFGPHRLHGTNALVNDVLDTSAAEQAGLLRDSVVQGFHWATREGPLTDEPVRGVKFRLLDATVADSVGGRSPAQVIPAARRAAYSSMLTASARLLEPVYMIETTCAPAALPLVHKVLQRRRGIVLEEGAVAGTPLGWLHGYLPVLESFGFETDIRSMTQGAAFCTQTFHHWDFLPGDPLDKNIVLQPLEPAGRRELARECMVKTRRRKGMTDDVSIVKYFDDPLLIELAQDDEDLRNLL